MSGDVKLALVPCTPTPEMIEAYFAACERNGFRAHINASCAWEAMLAASPSLPTPDAEPVAWQSRLINPFTKTWGNWEPCDPEAGMFSVEPGQFEMRPLYTHPDPTPSAVAQHEEVFRAGIEAAAKAVTDRIVTLLAFGGPGYEAQEAAVAERNALRKAIAADIRALSPTPAGDGWRPRVKPLEWRKHRDDHDWVACTQFDQTYIAVHLSAGWIVDCGSARIGGVHNTLGSAQAVAQADYEQRILSALDLPTPPAQGGSNGNG